MKIRAHPAAVALFLGICTALSAQVPVGETEWNSGTVAGAAPEEGLLSVPPSYGSTSYSTLVVSSWGFAPLGNGQWSHFLSTGWSHRADGNTTTCTNINLPTGALLHGITTYTNDTSPGSDVTYGLYVFHLADSTSDTEFSFSTSGTPGIQRAFRALPAPLTILNDQNAYVLCVAHGAAGSTNQNAGATLWYKLQVSPAPASATFGDVPTNHPFFRFVEALASAGITGGCGNGNFCPDQAVTRGQVAVFLSVALGLHFPN